MSNPMIFPDSMIDIINLFNVDVESDGDFEEVDLFAFKYTSQELEVELQDGIDANYDDFVGQNGYFYFDGHPVVVYIKFQESFQNKKKYHFTNCPVVSSNIAKDIYDNKFVMTTRRDGNFKVFNMYGKEVETSLEPCGHCCNNSRLQKKVNVEEVFTFLDKISNTESKKKLKRKPKNNHNSVISKEFVDGYVWNWKGISKIVRAKNGYVCQICKVNLTGSKYLLHVHHKNHDKQDNTESNLHILCAECHSNQDNHEHMKIRFNSQINDIRRIRKHQNSFNYNKIN